MAWPVVVPIKDISGLSARFSQRFPQVISLTFLMACHLSLSHYKLCALIMSFYFLYFLMFLHFGANWFLELVGDPPARARVMCQPASLEPGPSAPGLSWGSYTSAHSPCALIPPPPGAARTHPSPLQSFQVGNPQPACFHRNHRLSAHVSRPLCPKTGPGAPRGAPHSLRAPSSWGPRGADDLVLDSHFLVCWPHQKTRTPTF